MGGLMHNDDKRVCRRKPQSPAYHRDLKPVLFDERQHITHILWQTRIATLEQHTAIESPPLKTRVDRPFVADSVEKLGR